MGYVPPIPTSPKARVPAALAALMVPAACGVVWAMLFMTNSITLGGIPYSVMMQFWEDPIARNAYFSGNDQVLHGRLAELGIEASIRAYYRPKITDEAKLDLRIHQILYSHTGYVGEGYQVSDRGKLVPKSSDQSSLSPY